MLVVRATQSLLPYLMAIPACILVLTYALVNGVPFVYPDSFLYLSYGDSAWQKLEGVLPDFLPTYASDQVASGETVNPDQKAPVGNAWTPDPGRSVYYGALAALPGLFSSPWSGVVLQSYCSVLTLGLAWRATVGGLGWGYLASMAGLGLLSTFGVFASMAMPDVWAGLAIIAVAIIVAARHKIARIDECVLWGFVLFAAVSHSSHLAVLAILALLGVVARVLRLIQISWSNIAKLIAILILAPSLNLAARAAMERAAGRPSVGTPFLTAHLVDGGPGMDFIREACPKAGFAVCERAQELPVEWRLFIFQIATPENYRRRLVAEDMSFALATLGHRPKAVVGLAFRDAVRQVGMIRLSTTPLRSAIGESAALRNAPVELGGKVRSGRLYNADWLYSGLSILNAALVVASVIVLLFIATTRSVRPVSREIGLICTISIAGVLANAAVCGALASPYDRFQARVAWLIPFLAVIALAANLRRRGLHGSNHESRVQHGQG